MKLSHYSMVLFLVSLALFVPLMAGEQMNYAVAEKQIQYNNAVDNAVDDALNAARVESDDGKSTFLNRDEAVGFFFQSLFSGFGIVDDKNKQEQVRMCVPVMLFTEDDGYCIRYAGSYADELGGSRMNYVWTDMRPYAYEDKKNELLVLFSFGKDVTIIDRRNGERVEGYYTDLKAIYPNVAYLQSEADFEETRRACIIGHLTEDMEYFINSHNRLAAKAGISYKFELPRADKQDWYRTINDLGLLVLFQGYPMKDGFGSSYNRFAVGSARVRKGRAFYIASDHAGRKWYHCEGCPEVPMAQEQEICFSAKACAMKGAYPCQCTE